MKKIISTALAACLALSLAGCTFTTPASVGTIGDVDIPSGLYLLMQYDAYSTVAGQTDADTTDVKAVLASTITNEDETTQSAADLLAEETLKKMSHYAAVETRFAQLGGELTEEELASIDANTESQWSYYQETYEKNGIGKETLRASLANSQKEQDLLNLVYGKDGETPVTDAQLTTFLDTCVAGEAISLPLYNSSTYVFADEDATEAIGQLAENAAQSIRDGATVEEAGSTALTATFELLDSAFDTATLSNYVSSQVIFPADFDQFEDSDGKNEVKDVLTALKDGEVGVVNLGMSYMVMQKAPTLETYTLDELRDNALSEMKSQELTDSLDELAGTLEQNLDRSAMNTYAASKMSR